MNPSISIVIPVYNNPKTIKKVVEDALLLNMKVIVVDDGSTQRVETLLEKHNHLLVIRHEVNKGKGEALLTGAKIAKEQCFEHMVAMDGDG